MRFNNFLVFLLVLSSALTTYGQWWPELRHDSARTGKSEASGQIIIPETKWKYYLGGSVAPNQIVYGSSYPGLAANITMHISGGRIFALADGIFLWKSDLLKITKLWGLFDLNGDGTVELLAGTTDAILVMDVSNGSIVWASPPAGGEIKIVDIDGDPGLELIVRDPWNVSGLRAYDFSAELYNPDLRWVATMHVPKNGFEIVVGDADSDTATKEIIFDNNLGGSIVVLDAATGVELRYRSSRIHAASTSYGYAGLVNVDDDPNNEFVFTGASASYNDGKSIQLTVYEPVTDSIQWFYEFGQKTTEKELLLRPDGIADVTGDGIPEIIVSVFNNAEEILLQGKTVLSADRDGVNLPDRWATIIYRGSDGAVVGVLPDTVVEATADLDNDGKADIIVKRTISGIKTIPAIGAIEVWSFDESELIFLKDVVQNVGTIRGLPDYTEHLGAAYMPGALFLTDDGAGNHGFLVTQDTDIDGTADEISFLSFVGLNLITTVIDRIEPGTNVIFAARENDRFLISDTAGNLSSYVYFNGTFALERVYRSGGFAGRAIAVKTKPGNSVVTVTSTGKAVVLNSSSGSPLSSPMVRWEHVSTNTQPLHGVDRNTDDVYDLLFVDISTSGAGILSLYSGTGSLLWSHPFDESRTIPFSFVNGYFDSDTTVDIAYMINYSLAGPYIETVSGATGALLNRYSTLNAGTYQNRTLYVLPDHDGDGVNELYAVHPGKDEILSGRTLTPLTTWKGGQWGLNGVVADLNGDFSMELYAAHYTSPREIRALDGSLVWSFTFDSDASYAQYVANAPGLTVTPNGGFDLAFTGKFGDLSRYAGTDGSLLWKRCLSQGFSYEISLSTALKPYACEGLPLSDIASGDIDGDGLDEFLIGGQDGYLYAVNSEDGSLAWSYLFDYAVGNPILADVDDDGKIEIVVGVADGYLYAIDQKRYTAPIPVREVAVKKDKIDKPNTDIDAQSYAGQIGVAWSPVFKAKGYDVRIVNSSGAVITDVVTVTNGFQAIITDADIVSGQTYYAEVRGYDAKGYYSDWNRGDGATVNVPASKTMLSRIRNLFR